MSTFCNQVIRAKEGAAPTRRRNPADDSKIALIEDKIQHYLSNQDAYDFALIRQLAKEAGKLTAPQLKQLGERLRCPLSGKKGDMASRLEDWLIGIKHSTVQAGGSLATSVM